jgi:hypothetical protein
MANMPGAAAGAHHLAAAPAQTWSRDAPLARRSNDSDEPRILFLPGPQSIAGIPGHGDLKVWVVDRGGPRADGPTLDADGLLRFAGRSSICSSATRGGSSGRPTSARRTSRGRQRLGHIAAVTHLPPGPASDPGRPAPPRSPQPRHRARHDRGPLTHANRRTRPARSASVPRASPSVGPLPGRLAQHARR